MENKKSFITLIVAGLFILLAGCKKNKEPNDNQYDKERIKEYVESLPSNVIVTPLTYDDQKRNTAWIYTNIGFSRTRTFGSQTKTDRFIFNSDGLVAEIYIHRSGELRRYRISYDNNKRIVKTTEERQYFDINTGLNEGDISLQLTCEFTWDAQNNLSTIKSIYPTVRNGEKYNLYTFSGFSHTNTLQLRNIGLDFFGPYGFPGFFVLLPGAPIVQANFMGKHLPDAFTSQSYNTSNNPVGTARTYSFNFEKDSKGRITAFSTPFSGVSYRFFY